MEAKKKRTDIQCLRALAIIAVVVFHLGPTVMPLGFLGVDIFFVVSGYLMTSILTKMQNESVCMRLRKFYERRVLRIFPSYFGTVLVVVGIASFLLSAPEFKMLREESLFAIGFGTNWRSWWSENDYFCQLTDFSLLAHTWSLAVEVQFYLLAPFLVPLLARPKCSLWVIVGLCAISVTAHLCLPSPSLRFSFLGSRFWQFLTGTFTFRLESRWQSEGVKLSKCWQLTWIGLIITLTLPIHLRTLSEVLEILARVSATLLTGGIIVVAGQDCTYFHKSKFTSTLIAMFVYFGDISYVLYLTHWPLIVFVRYKLHPTPIMQFLLFIPILLLTVAVYHLFERQIAKQRPRYQYLMIAALLISSLLAFFLLPGLHPKIVGKRTAKYTNNAEVLRRCQEYYLERQCEFDVEFPFKPKNKDFPVVCRYKGSGNGTILFMGNSFANGYLDEFRNTYPKLFGEVYLVWSPGCIVYPGFNKNQGLCQCQKHEELLPKIVRHLRPEVIVVGEMANSPILNVPNISVKHLTEMSIYWEVLSEFTRRIVLVQPNAVLWDYFADSKRVYSENVYRRYRSTIHKSESPWSEYGWRHTVTATKNCSKCVHLLTDPYFCKDSVCQMFDPATDVTWYCDWLHLSVAGLSEWIGALANIVNNTQNIDTKIEIDLKAAENISRITT